MLPRYPGYGRLLPNNIRQTTNLLQLGHHKGVVYPRECWNEFLVTRFLFIGVRFLGKRGIREETDQGRDAGIYQGTSSSEVELEVSYCTVNLLSINSLVFAI